MDGQDDRLLFANGDICDDILFKVLLDITHRVKERVNVTGDKISIMMVAK